MYILPKFCSKTASLSGHRLFSASSILFSTAQEKAPQISSEPIAIFPRPQATVPTFEWSRTIGNTVCEVLYKLSFEKNYTRESLLIGANQGAVLLANAFISKNWNSIGNATTEDLLEKLKHARERYSDENVQLLQYTTDDIVHSFLHSTIITGKKIFKLSEQGNLGIYFTVVTYVRKNDSVPASITLTKAVGKYKKDLTAVNITFARTLNPLGVWKAVSFNMFNLPN